MVVKFSKYWLLAPLRSEGVRDDLHPKRLAEHIRMLAADRDLVKVAAAAFQVAKANFDYDLLGQKVSQLCEELLCA
jgi:hypothetical protein